MSLAILKRRGIVLPERETEDGLTAKEIMDKIRSFYRKFEKCNSEMSETAEGYFLELLYHYPLSVCNRHMTETQKLLTALLYFESKPQPEEEAPSWNGFSYEDLSIILGRSKATVHEAIKQKEAEAKQLLANVQLRKQAKDIALKQMVEEEKRKLMEKNQKKQANNRTNAQ